MIRNIIIGLLAVAVIALGYWGFQEQEQKQVLSINAENNYQRAFHDLTFHLDQIEDELGATLAMNTRRQLTPALAEVWRITSLAQAELGQLPLNSLQLGKTEEFLYKIGKFSYQTSIRDLDKEPLTDKEYETLNKLYDYSHEIREEMRESQAYVLKNGQRWLDIDKELQAATTEEPSRNLVVNNFEIMNKNVEGYSEVEWGAGLTSIEDLNGDLKRALSGKKKVSKEEAQDIARKYLDLGDRAAVHVADTGKGLEYPAYSLVIDDPDHETNYYMDMSVEGGHPIWFLQERQISDQNISLNDASNKAQKFLNENGMENMQLIESKQYDSIGMFEFVYLDNNVRVYTDAVMTEVALDDGSIISYEAKDYLINHKERDIKEPKLTLEEAETSVNPNVSVMEDHLAIIENDLGDEVLCYEFIGTIKDDTYRIFINADDGEEEKVDRLERAERVYDFS
ncbi:MULTISPECIES: germination protein YpeB [Alkalihalophilus]|uniref:germination protein YpeB n=1 Tax=Alkalihalophilus TaxID=2893060 RepID=UPI000952B685|nr:germination protein YpeB [Alkalihalophilus marmarensis]MEC2070794.1 germination protein YpeB [Alkalihalophilus marmarensis]OLS37932.1 germination protein YpeB [Alkalihalophilus pseudofirmus]